MNHSALGVKGVLWQEARGREEEAAGGWDTTEVTCENSEVRTEKEGHPGSQQLVFGEEVVMPPGLVHQESLPATTLW